MNSKQKSLALAITGLVGSIGSVAHAASSDGANTGSYLMYPYYTVNGGQDTLMSVVNSTNTGKIVKIRFFEAKNTKEVLDFNIFLSPWDVFTGGISKSTDGGAQFKWGDTTCTVPTFPNNTAPFSNSLLTERAGTATIDSSLTRLTEGHFEVIEMGTIIDTPTAVAIKHSSTTSASAGTVAGVPKDCGYVNTVGNVYANSSNTVAGYQTGAPTGGMFGSASVVNVGGGTTVSYDATALNGVYNNQQHFGPASQQPDPSSASTISTITANGNTYVANYASGAAAVSAPLMASAVMGEWVTDPSIGASTDFVVTFPTRRYHLQQGTCVNTALTSSPFTATNSFCNGGAPEIISTTIYDREEQPKAGAAGLCPSPLPPGGGACASSALPWETNVVTINNSKALGSAAGNQVNISPSGGTSGWVKLGLGTTTNTLTGTGIAAVGPTGVIPCASVTSQGLPVNGFVAQKYVNGNVGGLLSNYAANFALRTEKSVACN